ncbi:dienelactone hydrolase family protein [Clavibacter michiganensis]|uniref:dienelactone hydrolase family protein n=1 Tax=Clavibacter michiganensis TaxID=28447 RepID=UPI000A3B5004|nr:dienelactone hydrolase family protein [Clavibacter michiganensis]OUE12984.1 Carboxymethylenebutenolidase [Clavibacter michiganensis subsp. michiganensis]
MPVTLTEIPLPAASPDASPGLHGVLAVPEGEGPWPAVVVVHEAFGVTDVMRRQAERLAEAGFLALMPDLFSAGGARRCLVATFRTLAAGEGRAFVDVESARRALLARADCTGRVGVIGFCMGGGFALAAASRGFDASSVNYGMLPEDLDGVLDGACPIVASYGGRDRQLAGSADRLEAALVARGIDHDVREYAAAGHSFLNDAEMGPRPLRPVLRAVGMGPEPASAADAWRRIDAFLNAHLRGEERTGA